MSALAVIVVSVIVATVVAAIVVGVVLLTLLARVVRGEEDVNDVGLEILDYEPTYAPSVSDASSINSPGR